MKKLLPFLLLVLFFSQLNAQFSVKGEFRSRGEYRDGYKTLPSENRLPLEIMSQRTRLIFDFANENLQTKINIQDARVWGEDKWKTDNNGVGLKEAWVKYSFNEYVGFKVGRQELVYDDGRLFASGNWRNYGESHDVAYLIFKSEKANFEGHLGYSVSNESDAATGFAITSYDLAQYKNMSYFWLNKKFLDKKLSASLIGVRDGYQAADSSDINYRNTLGTYIKYLPGKLSLEGAYYMQTGRSTDDKEINANFYSFKAAYKIMKENLVWVAYDHYSGSDLNADSYSEETNTFNNLFGPGHKYLGYMDFFSIAGKHLAGINDLNFGITYMLPKKINLYANYHMFSLDQEYLKVNGVVTKVDKNLGSELDLILGRKFKNNLSIKFGYSFMLPTESMELLKLPDGSDYRFPQYGWIMITATPTFFKN